MDPATKMNLRTLWVFAIAIVFAGCLHAQDIVGNGQGTITPPQGKPLRMILQVAHDDGGALKARTYSIDQGPTGDWANSITVEDSTVKYVIGMIGLSYERKLSTDGETITGSWVQGGQTPFTFQRPQKRRRGAA